MKHYWWEPSKKELVFPSLVFSYVVVVILPEEFRGLPPEFKELGPSYRWANPQGVQEWLKMERQARDPNTRVRQGAKSQITWDKIRAADVPALFITGGADLYQPPSMMRAAATQLPGSKTLVLPEAGHAAQWEQPAKFNAAALQFFRMNS